MQAAVDPRRATWPVFPRIPGARVRSRKPPRRPSWVYVPVYVQRDGTLVALKKSTTIETVGSGVADREVPKISDGPSFCGFT